MSQKRYQTTYVFNGERPSDHREELTRIVQAVDDLQASGTEIEFLGATQHIDGDGRIEAMEARYAAPTKGSVGHLNVRAGLPASAQPVRDT